jgi:hypothetical protein
VGAFPWWSWLLPLLFAAPWIAGIVWFGSRLRGGGREEFPSAAEMSRRRLWTS